jgi:hypothetical protein
MSRSQVFLVPLILVVLHTTRPLGSTDLGCFCSSAESTLMQSILSMSMREPPPPCPLFPGKTGSEKSCCRLSSLQTDQNSNTRVSLLPCLIDVIGPSNTINIYAEEIRKKCAHCSSFRPLNIANKDENYIIAPCEHNLPARVLANELSAFQWCFVLLQSGFVTSVNVSKIRSEKSSVNQQQATIRRKLDQRYKSAMLNSGLCLRGGGHNVYRSRDDRKALHRAGGLILFFALVSSVFSSLGSLCKEVVAGWTHA